MTPTRPGGLRPCAIPGLVGVALLAGCGAAGGGAPECIEAGGPYPFPNHSPELNESSGAAWSLRHPGIIWTVGDGRIRTLFAVDTLGALRAEIPVELPGVWDVEDLEVGPCDEGSCIWFADTGDNGLRRDTLLIHRIPEPALDGPAPAPAEPLRLRLPEGPDDIEAMAIGGDGRIRLISKGSGRPPVHYRVPAEAGAEETRTAARIQTLDTVVRSLGNQITGASGVPGTDLIVLRTYTELSLWRIVDERLEPLPGATRSLGTLAEPQGEAVTVTREGEVVLTSEAGPFGRNAGMHRLRCTIPEAR